MPDTDAVRVIAGESTTTFFTADDASGDPTWRPEREQHGRLVTVVKPDGTTLVHDASGYQPVAWLTRPEHVTVERERASRVEDAADTEHTVVTATDGDSRLRVRVDDDARETHPTSTSGEPVGTCDCGGTLVRDTGGVACVACEARYGLPAGATVTEESCPDCGLPRFRVERGHEFTVCLDRTCESLDRAVTAAFDREFDCPDCDEPLRVLRRGGLILGCDAYPDCTFSATVPDGVLAGECDCGLPTYEPRGSGGERCLDAGCERGAT
jgi:DNA topoisomerase-1